MQHTIPLQQMIEQVGPQAQAMVQAVEACVHCGFCLPVCPTYHVLGEEMDSPRGRIILMKSVLEQNLPVEEALPYTDRCLGCLACVAACPSGVRYGDLLTQFRAYSRPLASERPLKRLQHALVTQTLPYPARFRVAAAAGRLARPFHAVLPQELSAMLDLLPFELGAARPFPDMIPAIGPRRARVALLVGCVQQALAPEINWATIRVLARNGVEIVIPQDQGCCGALLLHTGDHDAARRLALRNIESFPDDVDAVLTNAAGCGSGIHEYPLLFAGWPVVEQAAAFAHRTSDVTVFLEALGLLPPPGLKSPLRVAYHDACHLAHAQGITAPPRRLLSAIPNLELLEIADAVYCCGSAGTYNLEQPEIATDLGRRKVGNILATGAEAVATGNIGCMVQIRTHLEGMNAPLPVYHTLELLDRAYVT